MHVGTYYFSGNKNNNSISIIVDGRQVLKEFFSDGDTPVITFDYYPPQEKDQRTNCE